MQHKLKYFRYAKMFSQLIIYFGDYSMAWLLKNKKGRIIIGIPRALLYYRYSALWTGFFERLGAEVVISDATTKDTLDKGNNIAIDEMCLATKIFLGHVSNLIGNCDYIFIPRISNFGIKRYMCVKFQGLYDMTCNVFRDSGQKFISFNIIEKHQLTEKMAFVGLGQELGFERKKSEKAYKEAKEEEKTRREVLIQSQDQKLKSDKMKILLVAHSYVLEDEYIGKPIADCLKRLDCEIIRSDIVNPSDALKRSEIISPTLHWDISRELLGGIEIYKDKIDGIILLSAFPCNPDSMVNEMIIRTYSKIPILTLSLDTQCAETGTETRIESFIDIINFKKGKL